MGGAEIGNPPSKFARFFQAARERGFRTTVHAGEEGPAAYVREALELLHVDRIDHGNACLADPDLVRELAARRIPLTVCPLSNLRLKVVPSLEEHPLKAMMAQGLHVTVNSDDPPYFDGYVTENLLACRTRSTCRWRRSSAWSAMGWRPLCDGGGAPDPAQALDTYLARHVDNGACIR